MGKEGGRLYVLILRLSSGNPDTTGHTIDVEPRYSDSISDEDEKEPSKTTDEGDEGGE